MKTLTQDKLEKKYGPLQVDLLKDKSMRACHLRDSQNISRMLAITIYPKNRNSFPEVDEEIESGSPIGRTFIKYGYKIKKEISNDCIVKISNSLKNEFQTKKEIAQMKMYDLYVQYKDSPFLLYATIIEIYIP